MDDIETKPTPKAIDSLIEQFAEARDLAQNVAATAKMASDAADEIKVRLTAMVEKWGGRHTAKSRRLAGLRNTATTTTGTLVSIDDAAVEAMRLFLGSTETPRLSEEFFVAHTSYSLVSSPDEKLKGLHVGVRLRTKITGLLKACFEVKTKTPSLKVELADQMPAR